MSGSIKVLNSNGKTLEVKNSDLLSKDKTVVYLDTVEQATNYTGQDGDMIHISDSERGGTFTYDSTATDNGGTVFGKCVRQYEGAVNVKWFGADNTGATDSTTACQSAINTGESVTFSDGAYLVDNLQFNQPYATYRCENAILKLTSSNHSIGIISAGGVRFRNMIMSAGLKYVNKGIIVVNRDLADLEFVDCTFKETKVVASDPSPTLGTAFTTQYGLYFNMSGVQAVVRNCSFKDIGTYNFNQEATTAFSGGILFFNNVSTNIIKPNIEVSNCVFDNIYTDNNNGNIDYTDADAIRVYTGNTSDNLSINISDCSFYGVQKSAIKISGAEGIKINGIYIDATNTDVPMIAGVRLQSSNKTSLSNIVCKGNMYRVLYLRAYDVSVSDVTYTETSYGTAETLLVEIASIAGVVGEVNNIKINNVYAENIHQAFYVRDNHSAGSVQFVKDLVLSNVDVKMGNSPTLAFDMRNIKFGRFKNIVMSGDRVVDAISTTHCSDLEISGVFHANRYGFLEVNGCNRIELKDCSFTRDTQGQVYTTPFMQLNAGSVDKKLSNIDISVPTYDADSNTQAVNINGNYTVIDGIKTTVRNEGGGTRSYHQLLFTGDDCKVSNITLVNYSSTVTRAITIKACNRVNVNNSTNNTGSGLEFDVGNDNILVDGISGFPAVSGTAPTNSVVGTTFDWV